jgi:hypothetical protein
VNARCTDRRDLGKRGARLRGYNRSMATKRKARKPAKPRVSETALETAEIVALLRELREKMALLEEAPDTHECRA